MQSKTLAVFQNILKPEGFLKTFIYSLKRNNFISQPLI